MVDMKNERLQEIATRYCECIKVLLDLDRFDDKEHMLDSYPQQIRSIVNDKDIDGNGIMIAGKVTIDSSS